MGDTAADVRYPTKRELVRQLRAAPQLAHLQVVTALPSLDHDLEPDRIYVGSAQGAVEWPLAMEGRKWRDDQFELPVLVVAGGAGLTPDEAEERCSAYTTAFFDVAAEGLDLDRQVDGLEVFAIGSYDGPITVATETGAKSWAEITCDCEARIH